MALLLLLFGQNLAHDVFQLWRVGGLEVSLNLDVLVMRKSVQVLVMGRVVPSDSQFVVCREPLVAVSRQVLAPPGFGDSDVSTVGQIEKEA